jgi:hypothetical protein
MAEFARVLKTATDRYVKGANNETIENSIVLRELKRRNRIKYNYSGKALTWQLKYKQRTLTPVEDMEAIQFARQNLYEQPTLPWRGYRMQDAISEKERLMVKGNEALVQIWPGKMESIMEDANDRLNVEMFIDGNASGQTEQFHGLESIFGYTAHATNTYAAGNESYAGLTLNATHGTASDASAYTPKLVNEGSTALSSWTTNPTKIVRYLISACTIKNNRRGRPDMVLMNEARFLAFKDALASEERYIVGSKEQSNIKAGIEELTYDGVRLTWDYDCGADRCYCINFDHIELCLLTPRLWYSKVGYDHSRDAHTFSVNIWGNLKMNPRYQGKSKDMTS